MLSTGEIAKLCDVSVRTVQYYDRIGLLKPSLVNKNGFRYYSEINVFSLNCICLYKSLGFSLDEIKEILTNESTNYLSELMKVKSKEIESDIEKLKANIIKLNFAIEMLETKGYLPSSTIEELNEIMKKKNIYKKTNFITLLFLVLLVVFVLFIMPVFLKMGGLYVYLIIGVLILLSFGLVYYHSQTNAYVCPCCGKKFEISFIKDLFSLNGGKKGKKLKCPHCKEKRWFKETYKD